jgi:hypothetical protein
MVYKFNAPVWLRADIGLQHQPFGASKQQQQMGFNSSAFSGVYLKNASILYKPTENMGIMLQFSQIPASQMYLNNWNNRFGGGFMNSSFRATTGGTTDPFGW